MKKLSSILALLGMASVLFVCKNPLEEPPKRSNPFDKDYQPVLNLAPALESPTEDVVDLRPTFTWSGIKGAKTYHLIAYKKNSPQDSTFVINEQEIADSSYTPTASDSEIKVGTEYHWRVRSDNPPGKWSEAKSFKIYDRLAITNKRLDDAVRNERYSCQLAAIQGKGPYSWSSSRNLTGGFSLSTDGMLQAESVSTDADSLEIQVSVVDKSMPTPQSYTATFVLRVFDQITLERHRLNDGYATQVRYQDLIVVHGGSNGYHILNNTLTGFDVSLEDSTIYFNKAALIDAGTIEFSFDVEDDAIPPQNKSFPCTLRVYPRMTINPDLGTTFYATKGNTFEQLLTLAGGKGSITLENFQKPDWMNINKEGNGWKLVRLQVPDKATDSEIVLKFKDDANPPQLLDVNYPINVLGALGISPADPTFHVIHNKPRNPETFMANGGKASYAWDLIEHPDWITRDPSVGNSTQLSFKTTAINSSGLPISKEFKLKVTDGSIPPNTSTTSVTVKAAAPIEVTPVDNSSFDAVRGINFERGLSVRGGEGQYRWSIEGKGADYFRLSAENGSTTTLQSKGTSGQGSLSPKAPDEVTLAITATDQANPENFSTVNYTIKVYAPLEISTEPKSVPLAFKGDAYTLNLTASGGSGDYEWILGPQTPNWLKLSTNSGPRSVLTARAGLVPADATNTQIEIILKDKQRENASTKVTVDITVMSHIIITRPEMIFDAINGKPYSLPLVCTGGSNLKWSICEPRPTWINPNPGIGPSVNLRSQGNVSASATSYDVIVKAEDQNYPDNFYQLTVTIKVVDSLATSTNPRPSESGYSVMRNKTLPINIGVSGGVSPYRYVFDTKPTWVDTSSAAGPMVLTAKPDGNSKTVSFTMTISDFTKTSPAGGQSVDQKFTINVTELPEITNESLKNGVVDKQYGDTLSLRMGNADGYIWNMTGLPDGLTNNRNIITGKPKSECTTTVNVIIRRSPNEAPLLTHSFDLAIYKELDATFATGSDTLIYYSCQTEIKDILLGITGGKENYTLTQKGQDPFNAAFNNIENNITLQLSNRGLDSAQYILKDSASPFQADTLTFIANNFPGLAITPAIRPDRAGNAGGTKENPEPLLMTRTDTGYQAVLRAYCGTPDKSYVWQIDPDNVLQGKLSSEFSPSSGGQARETCTISFPEREASFLENKVFKATVQSEGDSSTQSRTFKIILPPATRWRR